MPVILWVMSEKYYNNDGSIPIMDNMETKEQLKVALGKYIVPISRLQLCL